VRFASETQPDPKPLLPYGRAANFDRRPSARGRPETFSLTESVEDRFLTHIGQF
jgi:hypothetical protein